MQFIDCGRALHIYTNGEAREFVRVDRMPNTYRRTEAQGGFALVVDYVQRTPWPLDVRWDFNRQATHPGSLTWLRPPPRGPMALLAADGGEGGETAELDCPKKTDRAPRSTRAHGRKRVGSGARGWG